MKKLIVIAVIITLVASFLGVSAASNEAKAFDGLSGSCQPFVGENCTAYYTATDNVDLEIEVYEDPYQGDDVLSIWVNSCNISAGWGGTTANVSLGPGYYEIAFRVDYSGMGPTAPLSYIITMNSYTGNYIYPCIVPLPLPTPPIEVGGDVYPVNKIAVLTPWLALAAALIVGAAVVVRRRRAQS